MATPAEFGGRMQSHRGAPILALAIISLTVLAGFATPIPSHVGDRRVDRDPQLLPGDGLRSGDPDSPLCVNCVIATTPVGTLPGAVVYDPGRQEVFVANFLSDNLSVISDQSNSVLKTIALASHPSALAYDSGKSEIFVAVESKSFTGFGNVSVISDSTDKVEHTIPVGELPSAVAYDPTSSELFVSNVDSNNISVISDVSNTVVASLSAGSDPGALLYDESSNELFVARYSANEVSIYSLTSKSIVANVPVGEGPSYMALDATTGDVYVSNSAVTNVSVLSPKTDTVLRSIVTGASNCGPMGLAYDGSTGDLYVAEECGTRHGPVLDNVTVLSTESGEVIASVHVGINPTAIAYDSGAGYVYVTNEASNNTSVIRVSLPGAGGRPPTLIGLPVPEGEALLGGFVVGVAIVMVLAVRQVRRVGSTPQGRPPDPARPEEEPPRTPT